MKRWRILFIVVLLVGLAKADAVRGAEAPRAIPVDHLVQAIAVPAGIVRAGEAPRFRGPGDRARTLVSAGSVCEEPVSSSRIGPWSQGATIWEMLAGLAARDPMVYVTAMSEDFRFDSDDPDFRAAYPNGMSRSDELSFATHILVGGAHGADGVALPAAIAVQVSAGPMVAGAAAGSGGRATIVLDHLHVRFRMSDGTNMDLSETRNTFELVSTEAGWKISRWSETHAGKAVADSLAARLAKAELAGADSPADALPAQLALAVHRDAGHGALVFELSLPARGGMLEMFDVMGRRVSQRDLSDLRPGRRTVALDGTVYPAGVYWARLRQDAATATARVVWTR